MLSGQQSQTCPELGAGRIQAIQAACLRRRPGESWAQRGPADKCLATQQSNVAESTRPRSTLHNFRNNNNNKHNNGSENTSEFGKWENALVLSDRCCLHRHCKSHFELRRTVRVAWLNRAGDAGWNEEAEKHCRASAFQIRRSIVAQ